MLLKYYLRAFHKPFASELAGLLFSKGLNYIKEVPPQPLSQIDGIVTEAEEQIPASDITPAPTSPTLPTSVLTTNQTS